MTTRTGIIFAELIGVLRRMAAPLYGVTVVVASFVICPTLAAAQGSDTVYDEAGALSGPEEQRVQQAFDSAQEETDSRFTPSWYRTRVWKARRRGRNY